MGTIAFNGTGSIDLADNVKNSDVKSDAGIAVTKLKHLHKPSSNFDLAIAGTPVAREEIVFVAGGVGTIRGFRCLLNDTGTTTDVDFDLKVNGSSVLSAVVNITNADGDMTVKTGTISSPALAVGDVVSLELIVTTSTGAQGPMAWADIDEPAQ